MLDFARADGETLVLVTADHDTGGLAILGGEEGQPMRIRWATGNHTAEPVPVLAYGTGAERFGGVLDNAEIGRMLSRVLIPADVDSATSPAAVPQAATDAEANESVGTVMGGDGNP